MLENSILNTNPSNRLEYIRGLIPHSQEHLVSLIMHLINTRSLQSHKEMSNVMKEWQTWLERGESLSEDKKQLVTRNLLSLLDASQSEKEGKELLEKLDRVQLKTVSQLQRYTKPVILAGGEEFKDEKDLNLFSSISNTIPQFNKLFLSKYLEYCYANPTEIQSRASEHFYYHLDMYKLAKCKGGWEVADWIFNRSSNFANFKVSLRLTGRISTMQWKEFTKSKRTLTSTTCLQRTTCHR